MRTKTNYLGVYQRTAKRKHLGKPDICYEITYKKGIKKIWEKIGYTSEGYGAKLANTIRAERIRSIRHGEELPSEKKKIPYFETSTKEYLNWCEDNKANRGKMQKIMSKHLTELNSKRLDEISSFLLEKIKSKLIKKELAPGSVKQVLCIFREIFNKALIWHNLNLKNPIKGVKMPTVQNEKTNFFSDKQIDLLLKELEFYPQIYDITLLSLRTGLRFKELAGIKKEDIDWKNNLIHVGDPKIKGDLSYVFLTADVKERLKRYDTASGALMFTNHDATKMREAPYSFKKTIKKLGFNEGISDRKQILTFHSLRHTFASRLALSGEQLITIKELMRHRDIKQTMRYAHLIPSYKRRAVEKLCDR